MIASSLSNQPPENRANEPLIDAKSVGVEYAKGKPAVANATFSISPQEFVALVGPSGCGKSTVLRAVAGLIESTSGELTIGGQLPAEARRRSQRVAFVFQDPTLLPWRSVADNIRLPLELQGMPRASQDEAIAKSLQLIGLSAEDARKRPKKLSGGMRMRVSLARALVTDPTLLLLDEPFAALDDVLRQQLNEELVHIWRLNRWTALFVTHNVSEAVFLSQRILIMSKRPGTIVADISIPFGESREPELRATAEFAQLCGVVSQKLRDAAR